MKRFARLDRAHLGHALLIASSALLAANALLGRAAAGVIPPVGMAFWRWLIAVAIVAPFALQGLFAKRRLLVAHWWRLLILGGLAMGICGANVYIGLSLTTATNTGLIYATSPVMILILARIFDGDRLSPTRGAGILLAFAGVSVILCGGDPGRLVALSFNEGDLWILSGAVAWAIFSLLLRRWPMGFTTVELFAANAMVGVIVLAPFLAWEIAARGPTTWNAHAVTLQVSIALFASVLPFLAYQETVRLIGPANAGVALYVLPLWTALAAAIWLGEALHGYHVAGAALVIPGVVLATRSR